MTCAGMGAMSPPHRVANQVTSSTCKTLQNPSGCDVVYDANGGSNAYTDDLACFEARRSDGLIWDLLVADDFTTNSAGVITDAYAFLYVSSSNGNAPRDGVRVYLWGAGEGPSDEPTGAWDVPPEQVQMRSLGWFEPVGFEMHVAGLTVPYSAGRNWISIQPRDLSVGARSYFLLRNENFPLHGADSYIKDGPNSETPGYGFTDWRTAGSQGFDVADSFIRLETCDSNEFAISLAGECGAQAQFSWENAPPDESLIGIYARTTGQFIIPQGFTCAGTALGLGSQGIRKVFQINTGTGSGSVSGRLRASACPGYFQAVIGGAGPCQTSNVISTP